MTEHATIVARECVPFWRRLLGRKPEYKLISLKRAYRTHENGFRYAAYKTVKAVIKCDLLFAVDSKAGFHKLRKRLDSGQDFILYLPLESDE